MAFEFRFPDVGEGIHEGRVVEWLVGEGDRVEEDQPLVLVETDKAVVEIPSPKSGDVLAHRIADGDVVHVGEVIAVLGAAGDPVATAAETSDRAAATLPDPAQAGSPPPAAAPSPLTSPLATPHTRALARALGLDLTTVLGTGKGGRITDEDVEHAARAPQPAAQPILAAPPVERPPARPAPPPTPAAPARVDDGDERVPITHLRRVIADAMAHSKQTAAHVTHVDEADVTELLALLKRLRAAGTEKSGPRLTLMPFFVKALVSALRQHPKFNATYDEARDELVLKKRYNIGVAVDGPEGLIVPVVADADRKSLMMLAEEISDLAGRARARRLGLDELKGGTCTATNIGPIGGLFATPIIHQPELAIVAFHTIKERPAVLDGQVVARKMMYLSVAFDHRFIDGAEAARFMNDLAGLLEKPELLMARM